MCSVPERAMVIMLAMLEDDTMTSSDLSKGRNDPSSNFSPWNMNADVLSHLGCDLDCARALGQAMAHAFTYAFFLYVTPRCSHMPLEKIPDHWRKSHTKSHTQSLTPHSSPKVPRTNSCWFRFISGVRLLNLARAE